jgi:hypothetical protein
METEGVSERRCPMCGRPNPAEAEQCQHCGARLTPLAGGGPPASGPPSGRSAGGEPENGQDWLRRIREQSESAGEPEFPEQGESDFAAELGGADMPSWLEEIEPEEASGEAGEEGPQASPFKSGGEPEGAEGLAEAEAPEWLRRIRAREEERAQAPEEPGEGWLSRLRGSPEQASTGPQQPGLPAEPAASPGLAAEPTPERPAGPPRRGSAAEDMPSWLRDAEGREPKGDQEGAPPGEAGSKTPPKEPALRPAQGPGAHRRGQRGTTWSHPTARGGTRSA